MDTADGESTDGTEHRLLAVAEILYARHDDILAIYERRLHEMGSPLVADPDNRAECLDHASLIVNDVLVCLRGESRQLGERGMALARGIGVSRATRSVHPNESLKAARVLFDVVAGCLADSGESAGLSNHDFLTALVTLNDSISRRIQEAAATYAGSLLGRIQQAHVDERRRVAREIHDRVGYGVAVALQSLELHNYYADKDPARAAQRIETAQVMLSKTIDSIREVTSDLRLPKPVESLEMALSSYLDSAVTDGTQVHVVVNGDETWAPSDVRAEVFLVVREALRNALLHAKPGAITVRIDIAPHELRAVIDDDGAGFDPNHLDGPANGVGVASMRERAALLGGAIEVASRRGLGTRVELLVPLEGRRDGRGE